jgi:hypothetical protein
MIPSMQMLCKGNAESCARRAGGLDERFCEVMDAAPVMIWVSGTDKLCIGTQPPGGKFDGLLG